MVREERVGCATGMPVVTRPGIRGGMGHHRSTYGVEFNIARTEQEIGLSLNQTRAVASLPQGAGAVIGGVDIGHIAATNGLHQFGQSIGLRGRHQQMDMIGHQDISMDGTARAFSRVLHRGEVEAIVFVTKENRLAIMTPLDDVLGNIKKIVPGVPRYDGFLC